MRPPSSSEGRGPDDLGRRERDVSFEFNKDEDAHRGEELRIFESYLRERGLKLTASRRRLLELIFADHSHFTADGLFEKTRAMALGVSKATLYRTLTVLIDCKLLTAHDFGDGSKHYEHVFGHEHHDHLICLACRSIVEFQSPAIERLQVQAATELGFVPTRHSLAIYGVCRSCRPTAKGRAALAEADIDPEIES